VNTHQPGRSRQSISSGFRGWRNVAAKTEISWTDATWTPLRARVKADAANIARAKGYASLIQIAEKMAGHVGPHCEHVSDGCKNCYSGTNNGRCLPANGTGLPFDRRARDLVDPFVDEKILVQPLHWRAPKKIFVCSQTDLFGEWASDEDIDRVFAVMALCRQHTFQILTKRPARMSRYLSGPDARRRIQDILAPTGNRTSDEAAKLFDNWPLRNVWLGVSTENQQTADERIPLLLKTPAAIRFVSYEPALGPVAFEPYICRDHRDGTPHEVARLDWIIAGGESGPGAQPANPEWFRSVRDQCAAAGVAFFMKQWGEYCTLDQVPEDTYQQLDAAGEVPDGGMLRVGKKAAGHLLDGVEHHAFPETRP
jgi:protein gp37